MTDEMFDLPAELTENDDLTRNENSFVENGGKKKNFKEFNLSFLNLTEHKSFGFETETNCMMNIILRVS